MSTKLSHYIKINDRKFFETNSDYKIIFDRNTIIEELKDIEDFKKIKCDFVKLNKLEEINNEKLINILGYVINISDIITINTKYGEKKVRRIIFQSPRNVMFLVYSTSYSNFCSQVILFLPFT